MPNHITIVYISLSGNTKSFVTRLSDHLTNQNYEVSSLNIKDLNHQTFKVNQPFVTIVPTYLEGGNGIDSGVTEILTTPLKDFLKAHLNYTRCVGVIGSGNRNFNNQYCLTAKQYSETFNFPILGDFELRGTSSNIERLAPIIAERINQWTHSYS